MVARFLSADKRHRRYTVLESATPGARPVSSDRLDRGHGGSYLLASLVLACARMSVELLELEAAPH